MHLHHDPASCGSGTPVPSGHAAGAPPGRPGGDPVRVVQRVLDRARRCPPGARSRRSSSSRARAPRRRRASRGRDLRRVDAEEDDVVDDPRRARLDPRRRDRRVRAELRVEQEAAVVVRRPRAPRGRTPSASAAGASTRPPAEGRAAPGLRPSAGPSTRPPARAQARIVARSLALNVRSCWPTYAGERAREATEA